jgi:hypothetical protein
MPVPVPDCSCASAKSAKVVYLDLYVEQNGRKCQNDIEQQRDMERKAKMNCHTDESMVLKFSCFSALWKRSYELSKSDIRTTTLALLAFHRNEPMAGLIFGLRYRVAVLKR